MRELEATLQKDYENVDAEIVANDLRVFLSSMIEAGLVEVAESR